MIRNRQWYGANAQRAYPVAETSSRIDNSGFVLPDNLIVDINLAIPRDFSTEVGISSVTRSPGLISVILAAAENESSQFSTFLTAATLAKPVQPYRQYPLLPLNEEVAGWITFGEAVLSDDLYSARFDLPAQSLLAPSAIKRYARPPLTSVGVLSQPGLQGLIGLAGGNDIEVAIECRDLPVPALPGQPSCDPLVTSRQPAIVIRLRESVDAVSSNLYDKYKGPCGSRPESRNCGSPQPIELFGTVAPDCCGNVTIYLEGCAYISQVLSATALDAEEDLVIGDEVVGVQLDCERSFDDVCLQNKLPGADGTLPHDYPDFCESLSVSSITLPEEEEISDPFFIDEESQDAAADITLPYENDFTWSDPLIEIRSGHFSLNTAAGFWSTGTDAGSALRNISTLDNEFNTLFKKVTAKFVLLPDSGGMGSLHNASVIAGYRETSSGSGFFRYFSAEVDWDGYYHGYKLLRLARFTGTMFVTELPVPVSELALGEEYELSLTVVQNTIRAGRAWLQADLIGIDNPELSITIGPLSVDYGDPTGKFGVAANRSAVDFTLLRIENLGG